MKRTARSVSPKDRATVIDDGAIGRVRALVELDQASVRAEGGAAVIGESGAAGVGFVKRDRAAIDKGPGAGRSVPDRFVAAVEANVTAINVSGTPGIGAFAEIAVGVVKSDQRPCGHAKLLKTESP